MKPWLLAGLGCLLALACPAQIHILQLQREGTLTWTNTADLTTFEVQTQTNRSGPWTTVATVNSPGLTNSVSVTFNGPSAVYRVGSGALYSDNAVGFAKLTLQKGYNLIGTPFVTGANGLIDIFPPDCGLPLDTFVVTWDPTRGSIGSVEPQTPFFYPGIAWDPPGPALPPGRGFFLYIDPVTASNAPYTVTVLGEPLGEASRRTCPPVVVYGDNRYNALANPEPYPGWVTTDLDLAPESDDLLLRWNSNRNPPYDNFSYIMDAGWVAWSDLGEPTLTEPTIGVGRGFMLFRSGRGSPWCGPFVLPPNIP